MTCSHRYVGNLAPCCSILVLWGFQCNIKLKWGYRPIFFFTLLTAVNCTFEIGVSEHLEVWRNNHKHLAANTSVPSRLKMFTLHTKRVFDWIQEQRTWHFYVVLKISYILRKSEMATTFLGSMPLKKQPPLRSCEQCELLHENEISYKTKLNFFCIPCNFTLHFWYSLIMMVEKHLSVSRSSWRNSLQDKNSFTRWMQSNWFVEKFMVSHNFTLYCDQETFPRICNIIYL